MKLLSRFLNWLFPFPADEYFSRFIAPHYQRGLEAGIAKEDLQAMFEVAMQYGHPIYGQPPGAIFRDLVDKRIQEATPQPAPDDSKE